MARAVLLCLLLAGCGGSSPPAPLPHPPFIGGISPSAPWAVTQGNPRHALTNGAFDFPACASADTCWVSYVEVPMLVDITAARKITVSYDITGGAPVFGINASASQCPGAARPVLILHQAGDDLSGKGAFAWYRWFSEPGPDLALGGFTHSVPLDDIHRWTAVYPGLPNQEIGFAKAKANIGLLGLGFGGGCFAAHGVAVTAGWATFRILAYNVVQ